MSSKKSKVVIRHDLFKKYYGKKKKSKKQTTKQQMSFVSGGTTKQLPIKAVSTPTRSFLSFAMNQPPKNLYASLKSSGYVNLNYSGWTQSLYPNSCFDPSGTLGARKPRYYQVYLGANNTSSLYGKYRVHETYIVFDITNLTNAPILFGTSTYKSGVTGVATPTSLAEARERSDTRTCIITNTTAKQTGRLSVRIKSKDILGYKDLADDDATGAPYSGNPSHLIVTQFFIMPLDGTDQTIEANISFQMLQKCQFYELNDVADPS